VEDIETIVFWCEKCRTVLLDASTEHCDGILEEIGMITGEIKNGNNRIISKNNV
jgi:predicted RNA-binding protein with PUA domain